MRGKCYGNNCLMLPWHFLIFYSLIVRGFLPLRWEMNCVSYLKNLNYLKILYSKAARCAKIGLKWAKTIL